MSRTAAATGAGSRPDARPATTAEIAPDAVDAGTIKILSEKVLLAWLRNRYQLLFPFTIALDRLDAARTSLFLNAMIAASVADGAMDGRERERIEAALTVVDPDGTRNAQLADALKAPEPLEIVLRRCEGTEGGALAYVAALLVVDRGKPVNRHFLRYLAARLTLPEELVASLEQRYRPPG